MGIKKLNVEPLASQFAERLAAQGKPLFYIRNINQGVSQGDIIRFRDKAVLIDGDVWQTMRSMGILRHLSDIPLLTLNARARSNVWDSRSKQVSNPGEIKGYTLGRELLKIFEDYFGSTPSGTELVIRFSGANMTMVAPRQLMNELNFTNVAPIRGAAGAPAFITTQPPERIFAGEPFEWRVWAIDPVEPASNINYTTASQLPAGLHWNSSRHTISGVPDETGAFPLTVLARNTRGQSVALNCTLVIVENTPPHIYVNTEEPAVSGSTWHNTPFVTDSEHLLNEIEVRLFEQPQGMVISQETKEIIWDVPESFVDTTISFYLAARDPLGATSREKVYLDVISYEVADAKVTIDLRLPLDTLIQGHLYRWPESILSVTEWNRREVKLVDVQGDDTTRFHTGDIQDEGLLMIRPMSHGSHTLNFTFALDTILIHVQKNCEVIPNRPPVFKSRLTAGTYKKNQHAVYTPVVFDKDGDALVLSVTDTSGNRWPLETGEFRLPTDQSGVHAFLLTAQDPFGNKARQHISYYVEPDRKHYRKWYIQQLYRSSLDVGYQSGGFRIGLYSTDIFKTLTTGFLGINTYETPLIYIGANPMGERQAALNNYLFLDCGISFRMYNEKLFGGGIMGRIQANYRKDGTSPWRFMGKFNTRIKQSIFVTDTSGLHDKLKGYVEDWPNFSENEIYEYIEKLASMFNAYGQPDNFGLYLSLQTLYHLPYGFWAGPSVWIRDDIKQPEITKETDFPYNNSGADWGNFLVQYTGFCILHELDYRRINLSQQLHLGWRGDSPTPELKWNATFRFLNRNYY
ncbi:hypothetical protein CHISP_2197 [Chitinispirillum alkaliphilum]|nr:hypothetical protein CHISP_2197 [Chitinispirillum alkaliphilum]